MQVLELTDYGATLVTLSTVYGNSYTISNCWFSNAVQPINPSMTQLTGTLVQGYIIASYKLINQDGLTPSIAFISFVDKTLYPSANYTVQSFGIYDINNNLIAYGNLNQTGPNTSVITKSYILFPNASVYTIDNIVLLNEFNFDTYQYFQNKLGNKSSFLSASDFIAHAQYGFTSNLSLTTSGIYVNIPSSYFNPGNGQADNVYGVTLDENTYVIFASLI